MSVVVARNKTADEYLAMERASPTKHEYFDGSIVAMAGGSERHNVICMNAGAELRSRLREKGCRVYPSDMRVGIPRKGGYYFYPDVTVVCDKPEVTGKNDVLLNPIAVIEVRSTAAAAYDEGEKFKLYRRITSLKVFVLISQKEPYVEVHERQDFNNWRTTYTEGVDQDVFFPVLDVTIPMRDIYAFVEFDPVDPESTGDVPPGMTDE